MFPVGVFDASAWQVLNAVVTARAEALSQRVFIRHLEAMLADLVAARFDRGETPDLSLCDVIIGSPDRQQRLKSGGEHGRGTFGAVPDHRLHRRGAAGVPRARSSPASCAVSTLAALSVPASTSTSTSTHSPCGARPGTPGDRERRSAVGAQNNSCPDPATPAANPRRLSTGDSAASSTLKARRVATSAGSAGRVTG